MPRFTIFDLVALQALAVKEIVDVPNHARLPGRDADLSVSEQQALALLLATCKFLGSLGIDTTSVVVDFDTPDSDAEE